ncbi:MAG: histidine kinase [Micromonosporaceae bacterium]
MPHRLRRWVAAWRARPRPERVVDVALSLAATTFTVLFALFPDTETAYDLETRHTPLVVASALAGLVLVLRRSHPLLTFLFVTAITATIVLSHWEPGGVAVTWVLAAYALGAYGSTRDGIVGLVAAASGIGLFFAMQAPYFDSIIGVAVLGQIGIAWLLGRAVARRRADASRARQRELAVARFGARATERAVLAERLRVARDLNDGASDAIAAITLQAAGRGAVGDRDGVLAMIERRSRDATDDLRQMLLALRDPATTPVLDDADPELRRALVDATGWDDHPASVSEPIDHRAPDWPVDVALGLGVAVLNVTGSVAPDPSTTHAGADPVLPVLVALAAAPGLALMVRRRHPVATLAVVAAALTAVSALDWRTGNLPGTLLIAIYALGAWATIRRGLAALVGLFGVMGMITVLGLGFGDNEDVWAAPVLLTVPWVLGAVIRQRRLSDEQQVERTLAVERDRAAATERALAEERIAVARDLHDLVSHNLAAITLQAAAARRRPSTPDFAAMTAIELAGRAALADLRAMLDALSRPDVGDLSPTPGLADLEALAARHRETNGPVEVRIDPAVDLEPESARLTAYRLVQEALTNVCRHAPGAGVTVRLAATDGVLVVDVEDDGAASSFLPPSPGSGLGLAGMRERVALFGGTLTAGGTPAGGFAVHAELSRGAAQ